MFQPGANCVSSAGCFITYSPRFECSFLLLVREWPSRGRNCRAATPRLGSEPRPKRFLDLAQPPKVRVGGHCIEKLIGDFSDWIEEVVRSDQAQACLGAISLNSPFRARLDPLAHLFHRLLFRRWSRLAPEELREHAGWCGRLIVQVDIAKQHGLSVENLAPISIPTDYAKIELIENWLALIGMLKAAE